MEKLIIDYFDAYLMPISAIIIGIVLGWIFKRFIHQRLKKFTESTEWKGDDVIFQAIESHIVLWFFLVALNIASSDLPFLTDSYHEYVSKIIISILILSVTLAASKVGVGLLNFWAERQGTNLPSTTIFVNLARIVIVSVGVLVILQSLGISITPLLTALGVGGLAVSLALKDTLSDFFAGLHILLSQKVKPGDFVELDTGYMGYIQNITWRHTTLMERTNNVVTVPNAKIAHSCIRTLQNHSSSIPFIILGEHLWILWILVDSVPLWIIVDPCGLLWILTNMERPCGAGVRRIFRSCTLTYGAICGAFFSANFQKCHF